MKKVLITGKNSYLGNQFYDACSSIFELTRISCRDDSWKNMDFSTYDSIYHVAGLAHSTPNESQRELYYQVNTQMTIDLAKKAKQEGVSQFIFMSSVIVYSSSCTTIDETTPLEPDNFYGDSKKQAEKELLELADDQFHVVIIRAPMIYGKNSKGNYRKLSSFAQKMPIFPTLKNQRSMLYVGNLVEFVKQSIEYNLSGIYFPQNKEYVSSYELVKEVAKVHHHNIHFVSIFNPILKGLKNQTMINKLFGDKVIETRCSTYHFEYQIYDFEQSIRLTEE